MEKRIEILVGERDSVERNLLRARSRNGELKAKVKSALASLRKACLGVCDVKEKGHKFVEEMQPFVEHLDAINTSFTNKGKMVEEMKRQLETEQAKEWRGKWWKK
ncbi:hypothetical protein SDJN03_09055, partial [Cucurbita argyrosperma subsp. sororia]